MRLVNAANKERLLEGLRDCKVSYRRANVAEAWAESNNAFTARLLPKGSTGAALTYQLQFVTRYYVKLDSLTVKLGRLARGPQGQFVIFYQTKQE